MVDIKDFVLHKIIGSGSFGKVYCATKTTNNDKHIRYAIKSSEKIVDKILKARNEISVLKMLLYSVFSVKIFYAFQSDKSTFLCLELLEGGRLRDVVKDKNLLLSYDEVVLLMAEILCGLEELNRKDIVHRDLKTDNILLDRLGHIRLADFGSAIVLKDGEFANELHTSPLYAVSGK